MNKRVMVISIKNINTPNYLSILKNAKKNGYTYISKYKELVKIVQTDYKMNKFEKNNLNVIEILDTADYYQQLIL